MSNWLDEVKFDSNGLIPAIAQHHQTGRVLMVAWMNREALQLTAEKKQAVYYSRSRQKLCIKAKNLDISRPYMKSVWTVMPM